MGVAVRVIPASFIGSTFHIIHKSIAGSANPVPVGGSSNQFQFLEQRGVVDSSLRADSIVPLAHAVVVLIVGPCYWENPGDLLVTRTDPENVRTRKFPVTWSNWESVANPLPLRHNLDRNFGTRTISSSCVEAAEFSEISQIEDYDVLLKRDIIIVKSCGYISCNQQLTSEESIFHIDSESDS